MRKITLIAILALLLSACDSGDAPPQEFVSASACAKRTPSGEIVDCEPSPDSVENQTQQLMAAMELDESHPGPTGPDIYQLEKSKLYLVEKIDLENTIYLNNSEKVSLAGLSCESKANELHRSLSIDFLGEYKHHIAYAFSGHKTNGVKLAYIWAVNTNPEMGISISSVNENAIMSKWCEPIEQERHQYHERYRKLAAIYK